MIIMNEQTKKKQLPIDPNLSITVPEFINYKKKNLKNEQNFCR